MPKAPAGGSRGRDPLDGCKVKFRTTVQKAWKDSIPPLNGFPWFQHHRSGRRIALLMPGNNGLPWFHFGRANGFRSSTVVSGGCGALA